MLDKIAELDNLAHKVLNQYIQLTETTEDIRRGCIEDQRRLQSQKQDTALEVAFVEKIFSRLLSAPESRALAQISQNLQLAYGTHDWSEGVVYNLEWMTKSLRYAKVHL
ncbi:MAG: hypothetical protein Q9188_005625, partial [Gyalolechia gomerana]